MDSKRIDGVVSVIPIPFKSDESINEEPLRRTVESAAAHGAAAMCLPAYDSGFFKLTEAERERVIGIAIETNQDRVSLIA